MKIQLPSVFQRWRRKLRRQATAGFTLTELLVTALIAGIITSGLMGLVYELLQTNQRDTVRAETQRDMQMALDFISSEIREAVYVYDGECLDGSEDRGCPGIFGGAGVLPDLGDDTVPVFALWKLKDLPEEARNQCESTSGDEFGECLAGQSHTLVIYALGRNQEDDIWEGAGRIIRYELSQFNSSNGDRRDYSSPIGDNCSYATWPCETPPSVNDWNAQVLVDYVHDRWVFDNRDINEDGSPDVDAACPDNSNYVITPSDDTLAAYGFGSPGSFVRNFYGCVRLPPGSTVAGTDDLDAAEDDARFNQKVILFLRGNIDGRFGADLDCQGLEDEDGANSDHFCLLPAIETQVVNRGVLEKEPFSLQ